MTFFHEEKAVSDKMHELSDEMHTDSTKRKAF